MARQLRHNLVVLAQADFFQVDGVTRVSGLTFGAVQSVLFFNNALAPWILTDGTGVTDAAVGSGRIFWNEILGAPSYYDVRFFPDAIGFWRLLLRYPAGTQTCILEFDIVSTPPVIEHGLRASVIGFDPERP